MGLRLRLRNLCAHRIGFPARAIQPGVDAALSRSGHQRRGATAGDVPTQTEGNGTAVCARLPSNEVLRSRPGPRVGSDSSPARLANDPAFVQVQGSELLTQLSPAP